jgi:hypothetical protein
MIPETVESLLIVTPCSALKTDPKSQFPLQSPNRPDQEIRLSRMRENNTLPARDLYTGIHHQSVMSDVDRLRDEMCHLNIGNRIISAKYGSISEWDEIGPYDESFAGLRPQAARARAKELQINASLASDLNAYQLVIFMLSANYLHAIEAPFGRNAFQIYLSPTSFTPATLHGTLVPCGVIEAARLGVAPRMAKAALFTKFVDQALTSGIEESLSLLVQGRFTEPVLEIQTA